MIQKGRELTFWIKLGDGVISEEAIHRIIGEGFTLQEATKRCRESTVPLNELILCLYNQINACRLES